MLTLRFATFALVNCTEQPAMPTADCWSTFLPFWPRIEAENVSGDAHRSALAARADPGPAGRASLNDVIGTSGTAPNVEVMPEPSAIVPLSPTVMPEPCRTA